MPVNVAARSNRTSQTAWTAGTLSQSQKDSTIPVRHAAGNSPYPAVHVALLFFAKFVVSIPCARNFRND